MTLPCATCHAAEDDHPDGPEEAEVLLGCTTGYRIRRGAAQAERAQATHDPKAICGRCGRQGHTREECSC